MFERSKGFPKPTRDFLSSSAITWKSSAHQNFNKMIVTTPTIYIVLINIKVNRRHVNKINLKSVLVKLALCSLLWNMIDPNRNRCSSHPIIEAPERSHIPFPTKPCLLNTQIIVKHAVLPTISPWSREMNSSGEISYLESQSIIQIARNIVSLHIPIPAKLRDVKFNYRKIFTVANQFVCCSEENSHSTSLLIIKYHRPQPESIAIPPVQPSREAWLCTFPENCLQFANKQWCSRQQFAIYACIQSIPPELEGLRLSVILKTEWMSD